MMKQSTPHFSYLLGHSEGRRELADLARIYMKCAGFDTSSMHGEGSREFTGWG